MYESSFDFHLRPFVAIPRPNWFFKSQSLAQTYQSVIGCIERATGTALIIGAPGTGKSVLCHVIAQEMRDTFKVVLLDSARLCTRRALLQSILFNLDLPFRAMEEGELRLTLIDHLQPSPGCPNGMLLVVDEAQTLPIRLLEEIRMISNLVRDGQPRVRLVLAGSREVEERFTQSSLDSFNQRIAVRGYLQPFDRDETIAYVRFQVEKASGRPNNEVFTTEGLNAVYDATDGIPRLINQLCDYALVQAAANGVRVVDEQTISSAWSEIQQLPTPWFTSKENEELAASIVEFGDLAPNSNGESFQSQELQESSEYAEDSIEHAESDEESLTLAESNQEPLETESENESDQQSSYESLMDEQEIHDHDTVVEVIESVDETSYKNDYETETTADMDSENEANSEYEVNTEYETNSESSEMESDQQQIETYDTVAQILSGSSQDAYSSDSVIEQDAISTNEMELPEITIEPESNENAQNDLEMEPTPPEFLFDVEENSTVEMITAVPEHTETISYDSQNSPDSSDYSTQVDVEPENSSLDSILDSVNSDVELRLDWKSLVSNSNETADSENNVAENVDDEVEHASMSTSDEVEDSMMTFADDEVDATHQPPGLHEDNDHDQPPTESEELVELEVSNSVADATVDSVDEISQVLDSIDADGAPEAPYEKTEASETTSSESEAAAEMDSFEQLKNISSEQLLSILGIKAIEKDSSSSEIAQEQQANAEQTKTQQSEDQQSQDEHSQLVESPNQETVDSLAESDAKLDAEMIPTTQAELEPPIEFDGPIDPFGEEFESEETIVETGDESRESMRANAQAAMSQPVSNEEPEANSNPEDDDPNKSPLVVVQDQQSIEETVKPKIMLFPENEQSEKPNVSSQVHREDYEKLFERLKNG